MIFLEGLYAYKLAVTAIMRNEGCNLEEWLNYHLLAGVQHFFLYDNESTDNTKEILEPYIKAGVVTYKFFPDRPHDAAIQMAAYNQALVQHRYDCEYMAFIDIDEFMVPVEDEDIYSVIKRIMEQSPFAAALTIRWRIFGSSGIEKRPASVVESYLYRGNDDFEHNRMVKTIVNPRKVLVLTNPHFAWYYNNFCAVNDSGKIIEGPFDESQSYSYLQLNHYFVKSKEDWQLKLSRGRADLPRNGKPPRSEEERIIHDRNEVYDDRILKYIEAVGDRNVQGGIDISEQLKEFLENSIDWYQHDIFPWSFEDFTSACCLCLRRYVEDKELTDYLDKLLCRYLEIMAQENTLKLWMDDYLVSLFYEQSDKGLLLKSKDLFWNYLKKIIAEKKMSDDMADYFMERLNAEIPDAYFLQ